ncbi:MAG: GGDEF domain-containing protein [Chlamydiota bacterium]
MDSFLQRRSKLELIAIALVLIAAPSYLTQATGGTISFSIFYLGPVALLSWYMGTAEGILAAIVSAAAWLRADVVATGNTNLIVLYWNAVVLFGFFLITALILARLKAAYQQEQELSRVDFLTGVPNGRAFRQVAEMEKHRVKRYRRPLTVAYMDIDNFKVVNDHYGHQTGDVLLVWVARSIRRNLRATDFVARVGGDEFAILLPETGAEAGQFVLYKMQRVLVDLVKQNSWPVTFSIGAATFVAEPESLDQMMQSADELMYTAKRNGRNRIAQAVVGA